MKGRSSIAFVKEKNVLKKCTKGGYSRGDGGRVLGVSFLFPYRSEIMLWEWLKLVKPQLVERSEKRSKRKNNWGWPVSPSVFIRVRSSRETRASQSTIACEAKEKRRQKKMKKPYFSRLSPVSPHFRPFLWPLALSWPTQKYGFFCGLTDEFDTLWYLVLKIMILPVRRYLMTPLYENVLKSGKLMLFDVPGESFSK